MLIGLLLLPASFIRRRIAGRSPVHEDTTRDVGVTSIQLKTYDYVTWPSSITFVPKLAGDMLQQGRTQRRVAARLQPLHKSK